MILGHQRGRVSGTALETTQNEEPHKLLKDSRSQNTEDKTGPQNVKTRGLVWLPKTNVLYLIFPNGGLCTAPGAGKVEKSSHCLTAEWTDSH